MERSQRFRILPKNIDGMTKEDYRIKYEHEGDVISPS